MYKLMAVDDEKAMCDVLADIIDWGELGVEFMGYSTNGYDAYEKALKWQPDIIMTDIKMPGMNGIELMKRLTEAGLQSRFLLLFSYAEFEYAREAMKYNVKVQFRRTLHDAKK